MEIHLQPAFLRRQLRHKNAGGLATPNTDIGGFRLTENPAIVKAFRRIGLSDQAGTGIRAIFRNWHELGRTPPQLKNDKARKDFDLVLINKPLVTEAMQCCARFSARSIGKRAWMPRRWR